jgi:hypothetical protein
VGDKLLLTGCVVHRIVFGFLYWAVLTLILPWARGYRLEEVAEVLPDGTTVTKLVRASRSGGIFG